MNKKRKSFLFLGLTLLILLISVGAASATDSDIGSTSMHDANLEKISSDNIVETQHKEVKKESVNKNTTHKKNNNIKTDKQPKKAVEPTTTVDNYETLKNTWNNIKTDGDNPTNYTINVKNGNYKFDEELEINSTSNINSITINGEDPDKTIFDGQNTTRLFNLNTTTLKINFNNITFANGFNNNTGGAIYSKATLNINNSKFINNTILPNGDYTSVYGGAIELENNFTIIYSLFENNTITRGYGYGGALSTTSEVIGSITNCEFINNEASRGTIYVDLSSNITMTKCVIYDENPYFGSWRPEHLNYNWYNLNSQYKGEDLVILVNNKTNFNMINQKNSNVTLQLYKYEPYYLHSFLIFLLV